MERINEIKISLMEKDIESTNKVKKHQDNFIIRSSASFNIEEYLMKNVKDKIKGKEYENFVSTSSKLIYDELLSKSSNKDAIDTVGVWVNINNQIFESSMDLDIMDKMEEYGDEGVNSIFELIKMTIPQDES